MTSPPSRIGIVGGSGYAGGELLRLCAQHPGLDARLATGDGHAGAPIADVHPGLAAVYGDRTFDKFDAERCDGLDLVFLALPHGAAQIVVPELLGRVGRIVDLSADFRLKDPALYPQWYGEEHPHPELLGEFTCGLPELFRADLLGATKVAAPGCYVTAATLALAPLLRARLIDATGIVVDAASGVSGAGRAPGAQTTFCAANEELTAYGLLTHRHTPEIEQNLAAVAAAEVQLIFTPHLAPMNRGILATCYARPTASPSANEVLDVMRDAYENEPFVVVTEGSPSTKATLGSNVAQVTAMADDRTGWIVALAALDNLTKGASGQAVQCANLMLGFPETTGLSMLGVYP